MKYTFLVLWLGMCGAFTSYAQTATVVETFSDISGQPFFPKQYVDVNGSPYMFDDWTTSTITLNDGRVIRNIKTNFNLVNNDLLYLDEKGQTMVANPSVVKTIEVAGRKFIPTEAKNTYLEVLSTQEKATLARHRKKVIMETKPFNSATIQKDFRVLESYILLRDGNASEVKSVNDLYQALTPELKEFVKKEKLRSKSADSWVKIVNYYNSI